MVTKKQISKLPLLVNSERATPPSQINIKTRLTVNFSWGIPECDYVLVQRELEVIEIAVIQEWKQSEAHVEVLK